MFLCFCLQIGLLLLFTSFYFFSPQQSDGYVTKIFFIEGKIPKRAKNGASSSHVRVSTLTLHFFSGSLAPTQIEIGPGGF